jgi:phytoene dehydrogenase-like protein
MLEPADLPPEIPQEVAKFPHMDWSFYSVHLAMQRAPEYRAAEFDPDVNRAWVVNVGYDSPKAINRHWKEIRAGRLPDPAPNCAVNSLYDPCDAPEGYYTGLMRHFAPFRLAEGGPEAWDRVGREYGERCIAKWREAAPNLEGEAILKWVPYTPLDIERRIPNMVQGDWMGGLIDLDNMLDKRPFAQLAQYKTPVEGLYMCGATQHPHGFVTFAPAYNALQAIADEYDLERWWR